MLELRTVLGRLLIVFIVGSACLPAKQGSPPISMARANPHPDPLRFDLSAIDRFGDPCGDFYAYACGGWLATHPIPPEKARISRYDEMVDRNESWTHELLEAAADEQRTRSPLEHQVGYD